MEKSRARAPLKQQTSTVLNVTIARNMSETQMLPLFEYALRNPLYMGISSPMRVQEAAIIIFRPDSLAR